MTTTYEVTYRKSKHHGHEAKTIIPLEGERQLSISTYKGSRGLFTSATVAKHRNGSMIFEIFGDFNKTIARSDKRATEPEVRRLHADALTCVPALLEEVAAFYAAKDRKEAA